METHPGSFSVILWHFFCEILPSPWPASCHAVIKEYWLVDCCTAEGGVPGTLRHWCRVRAEHGVVQGMGELCLLQDGRSVELFALFNAFTNDSMWKASCFQVVRCDVLSPHIVDGFEWNLMEIFITEWALLKWFLRSVPLTGQFWPAYYLFNNFTKNCAAILATAELLLGAAVTELWILKSTSERIFSRKTKNLLGGDWPLPYPDLKEKLCLCHLS